MDEATVLNIRSTYRSPSTTPSLPKNEWAGSRLFHTGSGLSHGDGGPSCLSDRHASCHQAASVLAHLLPRACCQAQGRNKSRGNKPAACCVERFHGALHACHECRDPVTCPLALRRPDEDEGKL